jgi:membrane protein implicated in regulation of membrane protease activity
MFDFLTELTWWHWIVGAIALAAIETFMPGAVAIWFAASAALIGLLLVVLPQMPWQWQWVLFAALGIVAMVLYRNYKKANPDVIEQPNLNRRGLQYVGQVFTLVEAMRDGTGKIQVGDSVWKVSGPDAPVGARVRVTGADATVLTVEPV